MCTIHRYLSAPYTAYHLCTVYGTRITDLTQYQLLDNATPAFPTAIPLLRKQAKPAKTESFQALGDTQCYNYLEKKS